MHQYRQFQGPNLKKKNSGRGKAPSPTILPVEKETSPFHTPWPYQISRGTPSMGRNIHRLGKICDVRFSTEITVYLGNGTR